MTDLKKVSPGAGGASSKPRHRTLLVYAPATEEDWRHAPLLIAELKEWDARQSQVLGFEPHEVMSVFYPDGIADIRRHSVSPLGCLLLAMDGPLPVGCAAFRRLTAEACEVYDEPCAWRRPRSCAPRTGFMNCFTSRSAHRIEAFPSAMRKLRCGWNVNSTPEASNT